jgi:hypothetical protein
VFYIVFIFLILQLFIYCEYNQFIFFTCHKFQGNIFSVFLYFELTYNVGLLTAEVHFSIIPVNT